MLNEVDFFWVTLYLLAILNGLLALFIFLKKRKYVLFFVKAIFLSGIVFFVAAFAFLIVWSVFSEAPQGPLVIIFIAPLVFGLGEIAGVLYASIASKSRS